MSTSAGRYTRLWLAAGFPEIDGFVDASTHYNALYKAAMDDHEHMLRCILTMPNRRRPGGIECHGCHHGEKGIRRYGPAERPATAL